MTNFVLVKTDFAAEIQKALRQRSIAIRVFPGFLRISAGSPDENRRFLAALEDILQQEVLP